MEVKGQIQVSELIAAQRLHLKPRPLFAVLGVILLAVCAWGLWLAFFGSHARSGFGRWAIIGFFVYLFIVYFGYMPYSWKKIYRQQKALQRQITYEIKDDALVCSTENAHASTPWADYAKWKENRELFVLYLADNLFHIVPKRFFPSSDGVDRLRSILKTKVSRK